MPAINQTIILKPSSAAEVRSGSGSAHWVTNTLPEATQQAGDMSLVVKALNAVVDSASNPIPWTYNGPSPNINDGMVRSNSVGASGGFVQLKVFVPSLRADPNEYISRATVRWRGNIVQSGAVPSDFTSAMKVVGHSGPGGAEVGSADITAADMAALVSGNPPGFPGSAGWYLSNVLPSADSALARSKDLAVMWQQTNLTASNKSGWTMIRMELEVELSLLNPFRAVG